MTTDRNKNRPGYKATKVGWIPEEWTPSKIGACFSLINGRAFKPQDWTTQGTPIIRIQNLNGSDDFNYFEGAFDQKHIIKKGDLLFSWSGSRGTSFGSFLWSGPTGVLNQHIFKVEPSPSIKHQFANHILRFVTISVEQRAHGAGGLVHVTKKTLEKEPLPLPPLPEQEAIAEVLGCWDAGLNTIEKLINEKKLRRKGLMQKLLTGTRRLPEFQKSEDGGQQSDWKEVTLGSICTVIKKAVGTKKITPMSLSAGKGFVSQADKFGRDISGKQYSKYTHLTKGCFTYNKGNSKTFPQGCAYLLEDYDEVAVPNVFISFKLNEKKADNKFFQQVFAANMHGKDLIKFINSGVRNDGLLNLNTTWFMRIKFNLPTLDEQKAIAEVLETADEEIRLLEAERDALSQQKKGLMQKLLTGEVRCAGFGGEAGLARTGKCDEL